MPTYTGSEDGKTYKTDWYQRCTIIVIRSVFAVYMCISAVYIIHRFDWVNNV